MYKIVVNGIVFFKIAQANSSVVVKGLGNALHRSSYYTTIYKAVNLSFCVLFQTIPGC